jgi:hypothetical protein
MNGAGMKPMKLALVMALVLAGCSGNPFPTGGGVDPDPDPTDADSAQLAGSLGSAKLVGGNLQVTLLPFDAPPVTATFVRAPTLDAGGYQAYVPVANPAVNRNFVAYVSSIDGAIAIAVGDGGRGVDAFGGAGISRTGLFASPTTGLATYRGGYAGLRTQGDGSVTARNPDRISGTTEINADFGDGSVEGSISNRVNLDDPMDILSDRFLKVTDVDAKGLFSGDVTSPGDTTVGTYTGAFTAGGRSVVGAVAIDDGDSSGFQDDVREYGVFALPCVLDDPAGSICP